MKKYLPYIAILTLILLLYAELTDEPEIITKTKVEYVDRHDTITNVIIQEKPIVRYVQKVKTIKGKDSIVYVSKEDSTAIKANEYKTELKSNNATARLNIVTSGELLDVSGVIDYKEKITHVETVKTRNKSGLFLYGQGSVKAINHEFSLGLDYVVKNKYILGSSISYDNYSKSMNINVKFGIKIF